MHDIIHRWAVAHHVPALAIADLLNQLGTGAEPLYVPTVTDGMNETPVSQRVRLAAAEAGILSWRNNVGAALTDTGMVRYGLCNDTEELNKRVKSADLIGIKPVLITQAMVGITIGQFWSREVKKGGWKYTGTEREVAQRAWAQLIISRGGDAAFTTGGI